MSKEVGELGGLVLMLRNTHDLEDPVDPEYLSCGKDVEANSFKDI